VSIPLVALFGQRPGIRDFGEQQNLNLQNQRLAGENALQPGQLQGQQNELQMQGLQLAQQRQQAADQRAATAAMNAWDGKSYDDLPKLFLQHGGSAHAAMDLASSLTKQQQQIYSLNESQLAIEKIKADHFLSSLDYVRALPPEQQPLAFENAKKLSVQKGWLDPKEAQGLQYQSPQQLDAYYKLYQGHSAGVEEGLKKAQSFEAQGKGQQAQAESNLFLAKTPGAQAESTIQQQQAAMDPQERALAGNLFYGAAGGDAQAGKALQLETAQKVAAAQATAAAQAPRRQEARADKGYQFAAGQIDKVGKPIEDAVARFGRLQDTLNQRTPQADALVAPELLTVMAGGQGSGLRMNEAEISRIVGGRSNLQSLQAALNKWQLDPSKALSITPAQRGQIQALMTEVHGKLLDKQNLLDDARQKLVDAESPEEQRQIITDTHKKLSQIDSGSSQTALPSGNGKFIDKATAQQFYRAAGNDPNKARQLALQNGWKVQ